MHWSLWQTRKTIKFYPKNMFKLFQGHVMCTRWLLLHSNNVSDALNHSHTKKIAKMLEGNIARPRMPICHAIIISRSARCADLDSNDTQKKSKFFFCSKCIFHSRNRRNEEKKFGFFSQKLVTMATVGEQFEKFERKFFFAQNASFTPKIQEIK